MRECSQDGERKKGIYTKQEQKNDVIQHRKIKKTKKKKRKKKKQS